MSALPEEHVRLVSIHESYSQDGLTFSREHVRPLPFLQPQSNANDRSFQDVSYVALSYTWGTQQEALICDGAEFCVSANLRPALFGIHKHFPGRLVWTDVLSIDQSNLGEKSYQMGIMGRIFSQAESVAVWLGDETSGLHDDLLTLASSSEADEEASKKRVQLLRQLSTIPWFYRVWTFQEIRLANNPVVLLGRNAMPWRDFIDNIMRVRRLEPWLSTVALHSLPRGYSRFGFVPQDRFFAMLEELNSGTATDLADLLFVTWYREATERRDKVYSLLSSELLTGVDHGIAIDYTISWPSLCIKAARAAINVGHDLKVLKIAGMTRRWKSPVTDRWDPNELRQLLSHPSWAPDWWRPNQQTRAPASLAFDDRGIFARLNFCCPALPPPQILDDKSPFLILKGIFLGLINVDQEPTYPGGSTLVHPAPLCTGTISEACFDPGDDKLIIPKIMTSIFTTAIDKHLQGSCLCLPLANRHSSFGPSGLSRKPLIASTKPPKLQFSNECFYLQSFARPAELSERQFPAQVLAESVESGDWLVLLEGSGQPFVLRPLKDLLGRIPRSSEFAGFADKQSLSPEDGCFMLVGEASMCWDRIWPDRWSRYCRAGSFIII